MFLCKCMILTVLNVYSRPTSIIRAHPHPICSQRGMMPARSPAIQTYIMLYARYPQLFSPGHQVSKNARLPTYAGISTHRAACTRGQFHRLSGCPAAPFPLRLPLGYARPSLLAPPNNEPPDSTAPSVPSTESASWQTG